MRVAVWATGDNGRACFASGHPRQDHVNQGTQEQTHSHGHTESYNQRDWEESRIIKMLWSIHRKHSPCAFYFHLNCFSPLLDVLFTLILNLLAATVLKKVGLGAIKGWKKGTGAKKKQLEEQNVSNRVKWQQVSQII